MMQWLKTVILPCFLFAGMAFCLWWLISPGSFVDSSSWPQIMALSASYWMFRLAVKIIGEDK